jgi:hypothetical protein
LEGFMADEKDNKQHIEKALHLLGVSCASDASPEDRARFGRLAVRTYQVLHNQSVQDIAESKPLRDDGVLDQDTMDAIVKSTLNGVVPFRGRPGVPSFTDMGCTMPGQPVRLDVGWTEPPGQNMQPASVPPTGPLGHPEKKHR